jgi:hypothetical protein
MDYKSLIALGESLNVVATDNNNMAEYFTAIETALTKLSSNQARIDCLSGATVPVLADVLADGTDSEWSDFDGAKAKITPHLTSVFGTPSAEADDSEWHELLAIVNEKGEDDPNAKNAGVAGYVSFIRKLDGQERVYQLATQALYNQSRKKEGFNNGEEKVLMKINNFAVLDSATNADGSRVVLTGAQGEYKVVQMNGTIYSTGVEGKYNRGKKISFQTNSTYLSRLANVLTFTGNSLVPEVPADGLWCDVIIKSAVAGETISMVTDNARLLQMESADAILSTRRGKPVGYIYDATDSTQESFQRIASIADERDVTRINNYVDRAIMLQADDESFGARLSIRHNFVTKSAKETGKLFKQLVDAGMDADSAIKYLTSQK